MIFTIKCNENHYPQWSKQINDSLTKVCLDMKNLRASDRELVFSLITGADFNRISIGSLATTEADQLMTVLGYRQPPKDDE
jgi:hypothetical protein